MTAVLDSRISDNPTDEFYAPSLLRKSYMEFVKRNRVEPSTIFASPVVYFAIKSSMIALLRKTDDANKCEVDGLPFVMKKALRDFEVEFQAN